MGVYGVYLVYGVYGFMGFVLPFFTFLETRLNFAVGAGKDLCRRFFHSHTNLFRHGLEIIENHLPVRPACLGHHGFRATRTG
jgi:hypothetical protein